MEVQTLADERGRTIYLGERDCSVQRRYQKLIEETPSPAVDDRLRRELGRVAVEAAQAVRYRDAGTVEFLLDKERRVFFFEVKKPDPGGDPLHPEGTGGDFLQEENKNAPRPPPVLQE